MYLSLSFILLWLALLFRAGTRHLFSYSNITKHRSPTWCILIKCWLSEWLNEKYCCHGWYECDHCPQQMENVFSHITRSPESVHSQAWVIHGRLECSLSSYFATLCLLLSLTCPLWLQSGCSSSRHSILHSVRPKIHTGRRGAFWRVKKTSPGDPDFPSCFIVQNYIDMPIPKPVIGKASGTDMIGLTSPGSHPQRDWEDFQPPLKILATPYLNKIKIPKARTMGRIGVEETIQ